MTMRETTRCRASRSVSSVLLLSFGLALVLVGGYFWFIRPPLLPEDLRYLGPSAGSIDAVIPKFDAWLRHVFRVLGGYIVASGILTTALAVTSYREGRASAALAAMAAGAASIGVMTGVNFSINSDFRWALAAIAALWATSIVMWAVESLRTSRSLNDPAATIPSLRGYERHYSEAAALNSTAAEVFAFADDFQKLSSHMTASSRMMMGSSMQTSFDADGGRSVGSHVIMRGRMMGTDLFLDEVVRVREPLQRKEWETVGSPQLLVIGRYRLGFEIASIRQLAELRVFIGYDLPSAPVWRFLGRFFGPLYAKWCVRQMIEGARSQFGDGR